MYTLLDNQIKSNLKTLFLLLKDIPYEIVERRKGDVDSLFASCQKAEQVL